MIKVSLLAAVILLSINSRLIAQDTNNVYGFDFKKLKPIVQVFGNAEYNPSAGVDKDYSFWFGRAHLGLQYQFNKSWSARIIVDRGNPTTVGKITVTDSAGHPLTVTNTSKEGAHYTMFLKFASLQYIVNKHLTLEGGAILQNHYIVQEKFWGYRYVAETFQDRYYSIPSSDLGFIAYYKISNKLGFDVALTNGEGPRVDQDAYAKIKLAGGFDFNPSKNFQSRLYYHNKASGIADRNATEQLFSIFAGFRKGEKYRFGGEFNYVDGYLNVKDLVSYGYSVYGSIGIAKNTQLFARYDRLLFNEPAVNPVVVQRNGSAYIGGVSVTPVKGVSLSLNYQGFDYDKADTKIQHRFLLSFEYKL